MSHSRDADQIKEKFLANLKSLGASVKTMEQLALSASDPEVRSVFKRLGQAQRNVYSVHGIGLINVHVRSESPGWWNVLKTVKGDLDTLRKDLGVRSWYVFLTGRNDRFIADGYIATDFDTSPFIRHPGIETTKYTINERQHLNNSKRLRSVEKIAKVLLDTSEA